MNKILIFCLRFIAEKKWSVLWIKCKCHVYRNAEPPLVSRTRRKNVVEHLKNMKLQNSIGTTTTAFIMHKTETDPVKVGKLIWRILNDPGSLTAADKKCFVIIGGNHSHAANLLALMVQPKNDNFKGMTSRVFALLPKLVGWWCGYAHRGGTGANSMRMLTF